MAYEKKPEDEKKISRAKSNAALTSVGLPQDDRARCDARRIRVARMILAGASTAEIAASEPETPLIIIKKDLQHIRNGWRAMMMQDIADHVAMQQMRVEALINACWTLSVAGHNDSVDRVIKLMERQAKLLGMDKAVKLEISTDEEADAADFDRRINQILAARAAEAGTDPGGEGQA